MTGELGCDIKFGSGINIVKAESLGGDNRTSNDCGKSTFTNLIKYGLGDRDQFSRGDISRRIQLIFLEIEMNRKVFTIRRDLNKPGARVAIFQDFYQSIYDFEEPSFLVDPKTPFSDFLLNELKIPQLKIPRSTKPGSKPQSVTVQEYLRVWYMDQKNSFQEIMYKVQPDWMKGKTIEILLGMAKEEVEELNNRIQSFTNEIDELQREINHITDFLISSGHANSLEIIEKISDKDRERKEISVKINEIKSHMRGQKGLTDELREGLDTINQKLFVLRENRSKMLFKMQDFQNLLNSFLVDRDKIQKTKESSFILSSVDFVKCPRCFQLVTTEMKLRENEGICLLCERSLLTEIEQTDILDKGDAVEEEIDEVKILLQNYEENLQELRSEIGHLEVEKNRIEEMLDLRTKTYVSPFVDDFERLLLLSNIVDAEIETLNSQLDQWNFLVSREELLTNLRIERQKLQRQVADIDIGDDVKVRKLSDYYESFLRRISDSEILKVRINPKDMMPLVNGNIYTEDVGSGMRAVRIIGYHYSLLDFSLDIACYYPRFLMIDSPRAFDLNRDTYERLLLQFHRLQSKLAQVDFQVILTTRDLPVVMEEYVIERLNSRNRMLLRVKEDREQSSSPYS